ncbi:MAG: cytochrome c [Desulforegulaceae bacterium]|nr:cytochrome c [Desulforegulaceae bacterium]
MKNFFKTTLCFFAGSTIAISTSFAFNEGTDKGVANILNTRCTACHGIEKVMKADHDKKGWENTITRMNNKKKFGKRLDPKQIKDLAEYISSIK